MRPKPTGVVPTSRPRPICVQCVLVLTPILILTLSPAASSEELRLAHLLAKYKTLKFETAALLAQRHESTRAPNNRQPLLSVRKQVMDFCFDLNKLIHIRSKAGDRSSLPVSLLGMAYSCDAMEQLLEAAFTLHGSNHDGAQSEVLQQIVRKYEELWKIADAAIDESNTP